MILKLVFWLIGLLICTFIGNFIPRITIKNLRPEPPAPLTLPLGILEILSYAISYIIGFPAFIAIWLALKTAGRWEPQETPSRITNSFLIGNLISVFIGVYLGVIFRSYLVHWGLIEYFKKCLSLG